MPQYEPGLVPVNPEELTNFLTEELRKIAESFSGIEDILLSEQHVEPAKPREGMIVLADGTNWNPGSGAGFYGYRGGTWNFLG